MTIKDKVKIGEQSYEIDLNFYAIRLFQEKFKISPVQFFLDFIKLQDNKDENEVLAKFPFEQLAYLAWCLIKGGTKGFKLEVEDIERSINMANMGSVLESMFEVIGKSLPKEKAKPEESKNE